MTDIDLKKDKLGWKGKVLVFGAMAFLAAGLIGRCSDMVGPGELNLLEAALDPETGTKAKFDDLKDSIGNKLPTFYGQRVIEIQAQYDSATGKLSTASLELGHESSPKQLRAVLGKYCGGAEEDWEKSAVMTGGVLKGKKCLVTYMEPHSFAWDIAIEAVGQAN